MNALEADQTLESIMSSPVQTLAGETSALEALGVAKRCEIHHFPVTDGAKLLGLVCTCDLEDVALTAPVRSAIRRPPVTLDVGDRIADAADQMRTALVGSVVVTRDGRAVGIVTREDLGRAGFDVRDAANFHCDSCGSVTHLKRQDGKGILCLDCRNRAVPESSLDETGVVD